ncbi:glycosyltransferase family 2 protein [Sphingomonas sp. Leaf357]|uniref:glycosyltransferase family 2 protein n=1 Tax=Sphingomonas sp. Leaf357 TaxID=1736350 RepID=UPI0012E16B57|nr:glycosyltransferase [Sphingomonas sp. Leaf357]
MKLDKRVAMTSSEDEPRISVVITCYNLERYIGPAIQSVLDQRRSPHEIIVIDDASTDRSVDVIAAFGNGVRLVKLDRNGGVLNATLTGIRASTGNIVAFLDGDDLWSPEKLAVIAPIWRDRADVVLLSHDYAIIDAEGLRTRTLDDTQRNTRRIVRRHADQEGLSEALKQSILSYRGVWLGSAFSIRRAAIDLVELERFIDSVSVPMFRRLSYQDHLIAQFVIVTNTGSQVGFVNQPLFQYRIFTGNTSGQSQTKQQALRTITRGYVNVLGTQRLLQGFPDHRKQLRRQALMAQDFRYMAALYSGQIFYAASRAALLACTYWSSRRLAKELARIALVTVWGSERFLDRKSRR